MTQITLSQISLASSLPTSLKNLIASLKNQRALSPEIVRQLVIEAHITAEDLLPWADFNHSIADSYGRQLVYEEKNFEILVMSWAAGDYSAIHDHGVAQWGAVKCFGSAEHSVYKLEDNILYTTARTNLQPGTVEAVDRSLIHQMGNPSNDCFLSLHVYGCDKNYDSITANTRIFDLYSESIIYTDGGVFFCLPETEIKYRTYGLRGDIPTTLHHHQCLKSRLLRMLNKVDSEYSKVTQLLGYLEQQISLLSLPG